MRQLRSFKFKFHGRTWTVRFVKRVDENDSWGENDPATAVILLKKVANMGTLRSTFWHEIAHIMLEAFDDGLKLPKDEELLCNTISAGLMEIRPQIPKWL